MPELVIDHNSKRNKQIDQFEADILQNFGKGEATYRHFFSGGMYAREMTIKAGQFITSLIHKTEHLFIVSKGKLLVSVDDGESVEIEAPYMGITKPGTRRAAYVLKDVVWSTIHRTDIKPVGDSEEDVLKAVELIKQEIIEPHENSILGGVLVNNVLTKTIKS